MKKTIRVLWRRAGTTYQSIINAFANPESVANTLLLERHVAKREIVQWEVREVLLPAVHGRLKVPVGEELVGGVPVGIRDAGRVAVDEVARPVGGQDVGDG